MIGALSHGADVSGWVVVVTVTTVVVVVAIEVVEADVVPADDSMAVPQEAVRTATVKNAINLRIEHPFQCQDRGRSPVDR